VPIFEYRCSDCDKQFEELVLSRSHARVECPQCSSTKVEQLISRFATVSSNSGECFNRSAGVCQAGGGPMS